MFLNTIIIGLLLYNGGGHGFCPMAWPKVNNECAHSDLITRGEKKIFVAFLLGKSNLRLLAVLCSNLSRTSPLLDSCVRKRGKATIPKRRRAAALQRRFASVTAPSRRFKAVADSNGRRLAPYSRNSAKINLAIHLRTTIFLSLAFPESMRQQTKSLLLCLTCLPIN